MIIYWTKSSSDFFSTASDWSSGTVPGVFDQAQINAPGSYTVTVNDSEAVLSLSTAFEAILDITGTGHLFMAEGTGDGANFGTILLGDAAGLEASGTIANNGFIVLESTGDLTSVSPILGPLTLSGGGLGIVMLSDNSNNELDITTNVNNYIVGAGTVSLSNNKKKGVIQASGTNPLVINSSDKTLINAGTLKATGTGGLQLDGIIDGSSGGLIMAASGATVTLVGATLIGGTLSSGRINDPGGNATFDGIKATVNNAAGVEIADNASLEIEGKINNTGSITIYFGLILIDGPSVALEGRGTIALDQSNAYQANLVSNAAHATPH